MNKTSPLVSIIAFVIAVISVRSCDNSALEKDKRIRSKLEKYGRLMDECTDREVKLHSGRNARVYAENECQHIYNVYYDGTYMGWVSYSDL